MSSDSECEYFAIFGSSASKYGICAHSESQPINLCKPITKTSRVLSQEVGFFVLLYSRVYLSTTWACIFLCRLRRSLDGGRKKTDGHFCLDIHDLRCRAVLYHLF